MLALMMNRPSERGYREQVLPAILNASAEARTSFRAILLSVFLSLLSISFITSITSASEMPDGCAVDEVKRRRSFLPTTRNSN